MEPDAGKLGFDFLWGGLWEAVPQTCAFELPGLADGRGQKLVFLAQRHSFPSGSLQG